MMLTMSTTGHHRYLVTTMQLVSGNFCRSGSLLLKLERHVFTSFEETVGTHKVHVGSQLTRPAITHVERALSSGMMSQSLLFPELLQRGCDGVHDA